MVGIRRAAVKHGTCAVSIGRGWRRPPRLKVLRGRDARGRAIDARDREGSCRAPVCSHSRRAQIQGKCFRQVPLSCSHRGALPGAGPECREVRKPPRTRAFPFQSTGSRRWARRSCGASKGPDVPSARPGTRSVPSRGRFNGVFPSEPLGGDHGTSEAPRRGPALRSASGRT